MKKLKIVMIGPCRSGKSTIANFLSEAIDYVSDDYRPTEGVRILEFEIKNRNIEAEVELWDCSGDIKYEDVWPVFLWNTQGVVLVYNPDEQEQLQNLDVFHNHFVTQSSIPSNNCLIIAHYRDLQPKQTLPELSKPMMNVSQLSANVLENGDELKASFEGFVGSLLNDAKDIEKDNLFSQDMYDE